MNDQSTGFEAQSAHKTEIGLSSHQPSQQTDRIEKFTKAIRLLARESLGTSRYSLLLEGPTYVIFVNPKEHSYYAIDRKNVADSLKGISEEIMNKLTSKSLLAAIMRDQQNLPEEISAESFDQSYLEVRSRLPVFNYLTDSEVRKKLEQTFGSRAGDARNLFMEVARQHYDLAEIQSFLLLTEDDLLWMITWGIEEKILFLEGEDDIEEDTSESLLIGKDDVRI
ncbi:MAG: hypothetical protein ACXACI_04045 [Candidatus Hodarchaeales archaeon]|jgi:hypothetical protein